eukprot:239690_1
MAAKLAKKFQNFGSGIIKSKPRKETGGVRSSMAEESTLLSKDEIMALPSNAEIGDQLKEVPFLARLSPEKRNKIGGAFRTKSIKAGTSFIQQGEPGTEFFIITKGEADITFTDENGNSHDVAVLTTGDYCGETALVTNDVRNATVTAKSEMDVLVLSAKVFRSLFTKEFMNVQFGHREAVSAEELPAPTAGSDRASSVAAANKRKSCYTADKIKQALKDNILFRNIDDLHIIEIVSNMWRLEVTKGKEVIRQGDRGDFLYCVEEGKFGVYTTRAVRSFFSRTFGHGEGEVEKLTILSVGKCFGELALMYDSPRTATIMAETDGVLWVIDRQTFRRILTRATSTKISEYEKFLVKVPILSALLSSERSQVAEALEEQLFPDSLEIVTQGKKGDTFYIVKTGMAVVSVKEKGETSSKEVQTLKSGDYFGERALLTDDTRAATVTVKGGPMECLVLDRAAFDRLLGPLKTILQRQVATYDADAKENNDRVLQKITYEDLTCLGTLGRGAFGHVKLMKHKESKETYAMKSVSKALIVYKGQKDHIRNERKILMRLKGHYFVNLCQTFNTQDHIHFVMEPALGGELFTLLRDKTHFSEPTARFYAATVVLAFEYLHARHIIYRDLKPENLLLDKDGYIKMTDFGFAKVVRDRTWTLCGTPDYLAPEMVSGAPHGKGVDWWTVGILIFEMLASYPPFYASDQMKTYKKIIRGKIKFPKHFSKESVSLIKALTNVKPTRRLGVTVGGAAAVKAHPWFRGFDWNSLISRSTKAPIVPTITDNCDLSNFDNYPEDEKAVQKYVDDGTGWDAEF